MRSSRVTMPASTPIHKATIIPRGRALGMVQSLPERDQISQSYEQLISLLAMAMGGRVAEELVFGKDKVTSGAAGDIQQVTKIARAMVTRLGFSDKLGTVMYGENQEEVFLGYSMGRQQNISEETAKTIDEEVRRLIHEAHDTATRILTERRDDLETLANGLMEFETLSGEEIVGLLQGRAPGARHRRQGAARRRRVRRCRPPASRAASAPTRASRPSRRPEHANGRPSGRPFCLWPLSAAAWKRRAGALRGLHALSPRSPFTHRQLTSTKHADSSTNFRQLARRTDRLNTCRLRMIA